MSKLPAWTESTEKMSTELDNIFNSGDEELSPVPKPKLVYSTINRTNSQLRLLAESFILPGRDSAVDQIMVVLPKSEENISDSCQIEREVWGSGLEYLLSCIGFAVGLGNIWRFPYLCYKSGGGAFLIPYFAFLVLCGFPLFYMETAYGQFASLSPISVWRLSPLFKGIGYGMVIICTIVCIYYNIIISWTFYYIYMSMNATLPWTTCENHWNTYKCVSSIQEKFKSLNQNQTNTSQFQTASLEFWERNVLRQSNGIESLGEIRWPLFWCLLLAWFLVFLCLSKGVKSSGKVVYFTSLFPYIVLTVLLVRGVTLPGAMIGIRFYVIPDWSKLLDLKVWGDAAVQIFYSVGMAWGSLITMASYNNFKHNVFRDAMIVPIVNCGTSVFAGFVIFSVLGYMAHATDTAINQVVDQGPGLIFVVYPEAISKLPVPQLWSVMFFLMIFTVGIDSQGGIYILQIIDWYSASFSLMLLSFMECIVISWIYGINRFLKDIELMLGKKPFIYWKIMWKFITPTIILFTWGFSVSNIGTVTLGQYRYPTWAILTGWMCGVCSLIPVPLTAIIAVSRDKSGTFVQRVRRLAQPAPNWGPSQAADKERYYNSMDDAEFERYEAALLNVDLKSYAKMKKMSSFSDSPSSPKKARPLSPTNSITLYSNIINSV
ncbi:sodium- and chloride-dependent glycine transporter 1-like isoform X2 [Biomphalaria glabrata]|uniref:Transporter n=1 Tax=Biomphalaria glabrata TaxID=6526 RepID=A0A9W3B7U9_BIOGL|nr:sodium- and chloride-dependent glycine transporter 1-like isoform X2 [Biomphalaria glabrata]